MKHRLFALLCFFLLSFTGISQEDPRVLGLQNQLQALKVEAPGLSENLDINITQASLSNFLLAISDIHKINISVDPSLNSINVVNNFTDVSVEDVLIFLVKTYELDIDFTGSILAISKYEPPLRDENDINVSYDPTTQLITLDLENNQLDKAFRTITNRTGKNLLYAAEIQKTPITLYIKDVSIDVALQRLAKANNLSVSVSRDGLYYFDQLFSTGQNASAAANRPRRNRSSSFNYKVLDTLNRRLKVDFQNVPVADVIYTIAEDLHLDIFTASPLDNAGNCSVKAKNVDFETLLDKIFESIQYTAPQNQGNSRNTIAQILDSYTYKKENEVYFIGTENQLSLKQVELVVMKNRAVNKFIDPKRSVQRNRNQEFVTGGTNFNGQRTNNPSSRVPTTSSFNETGSVYTELESIESVFPDDIKQGLQISTDFELNGFVVSGPGIKVERFKAFVEEIDKKVPAILFDVMILEVSRSAITETGISFGLGDRPSRTQGEVFPNTDIRLGSNTVNKVIGRFNGFGSLNIGKVLPEFYLDIQAKEQNGDLKILSTPRLTAFNSHKAYLSSSNTTYYVVTDQTFVGSQIPQTTQIRNFVPITAELALEIVPFMSGDGQITLDIQVIQSSFSGERIDEDAPPNINTREFSSIVRMQDGEMAVLGGIEQQIKDNSGSGVPFLARIPIIKYLFSKRRRESTKRDLTILIQPTVID